MKDERRKWKERWKVGGVIMEINAKTRVDQRVTFASLRLCVKGIADNFS